MDHRNHQAVRHRQRLRGAAAPLGGGTNLRMAQPQPTSRQGLRTNHRLSNRLAVHRINPALHTPYRKSMKLHEIVLNQTLTSHNTSTTPRQKTSILVTLCENIPLL